MNTPRPNLAPTSPHARGDLPTGDLAPRPHPFGGEVSPETPTATTTHTPTPRPRGDVITATITDHLPATLACDSYWHYDVDFTAACSLATGHPGPHTTTLDGNDQITAHLTWPSPARMEVAL